MEAGGRVRAVGVDTTKAQDPLAMFHTTVPITCVKSKVSKRYQDSFALYPLSWDFILTVYSELVKLVNRLPFQKRLVVCLVFRGSKFRLDLGEVKTAGIACLIGLGLSLGTLVLYRLYFRIIVPFINKLWAAKGEDAVLDDEYTLYLEPSDSAVDDRMGNSNSKKPAPNVYYAPGYGVALGSRSPSLTLSNDLESPGEEHVRLRPHRLPRQKSPSPASDKDSAIGGVGGSEMSQSLYSDISINRDSFYSICTTESGFDDFGFLEELRASKLSGSLKENFSPGSLREKNLQMLYRAHHGHDPGLNNIGKSVKPGLDTVSDCSSSEKSGIYARSQRGSCDSIDSSQFIRTNVDPLVERLAGSNSTSGRTSSRHSRVSSDRCTSGFSHVPSEHGASASAFKSPRNSSSPQRHVSSHSSSPSKLTPTPNQLRSASHLHPLHCHHPLQQQQQQQHYHPGGSNLSDNVFEYDPYIDVSESIRSFNSSAENSDWDGGEEQGAEIQGRMSLPPHLNQSLSDIQFKQSLMQRIQEWSSFAEEYNNSRSPTPHCSPVRFVRRSRSLDRHIGDPSVLAADHEIAASKPIEIEPVTEKNLETLEYELHGIQGEFESITSKLHELIEQGASNEDGPSTSQGGDGPSKPHGSSSTNVLSSLPHSSTFTPRCSECGVRSESTPRTIENKYSMMRKMKTRWEKVPSSGCSESGRSSRGSSVEYVWDMGDFTSHNSTADRSKVDGAGFNVSPHRSSPRPDSTDLCNPLEAADVIKNISLPVNITEYAQAEWKGGTDKAITIMEGYKQISNLLGHERLCIARGDNYCGLRSALFQLLVNGIRATENWPGIIGIMDSLHTLFEDASVQLSKWSFANRLPGHCKDKLASLSKCALSLYATIEEVCNLPTREQREKRVINLFNTNPTFDIELMEGLKVMMLLEAVSLRQKICDEEEIPFFGHLLFARETSETVSDFLWNHLNCMGDSGGLEQVEMCLLGNALGVRIRVLRLSQCGQQDFDCIFPEDVPSDWPVISLIAEDDRHYNMSLP